MACFEAGDEDEPDLSRKYCTTVRTIRLRTERQYGEGLLVGNRA